MEALDILEKRVETLARILGNDPELAARNSTNTNTTESGKSAMSPTENIVDSLVSAQTLLNEATNGRDLINKAMTRTAELEKYLDPNFLEDNQQVRAKEVYLTAVGNELHSQFVQLEQIKKLEPTLGAEYFRNIPGECVEKLKQVSEDNLEFAQQSELIEESLILAMKRYGEIQASLLQALGDMNKRLDAMEEKVQQRKREESEKELIVTEEAK